MKGSNFSINDRLQHGYLTPQEVAELLGLGMTKTFELIRAGTLESCKVGRSRRIPGPAIQTLMTAGAKDSRRKSAPSAREQTRAAK